LDQILCHKLAGGNGIGNLFSGGKGGAAAGLGRGFIAGFESKNLVREMQV